jgi:hypothetical protein
MAIEYDEIVEGRFYKVKQIIHNGRPMDGEIEIVRCFNWAEKWERPRLRYEFIGSDEIGSPHEYTILCELNLVEVEENNEA